MLINTLKHVWRSLAERRTYCAGFQRGIEREAPATPATEGQLRTRLHEDPADTNAWFGLASLLANAGREKEALYCHQTVLQLSPRHFWSSVGAAGLLHRCGELESALALYRTALDIDRNNAGPIFVNMGVVLKDMVRIPEAIECYQQSIANHSHLAEAHYNLGLLYYDTGRIEESEFHLSKAIQHKPDLAAAHSSLLCIQGLSRNQDPKRLFDEHRRWATTYADPLRLASTPRSFKAVNDRLVIGYVSADLREHSISYFVEPVLSHHDRQSFRVICYDNWRGEDRVNLRLRTYVDAWRKIDEMSDVDVAALVQRDGVDILVDLSGHTAGNRLLVFARKPAPVQATWLGYMCTTGLAAMDYRITDAYLDPPGKTEAYYSEKLMRIAAAAAFAPAPESPAVNRLPALDRGFVTFLSVNNFTKVNDEVIKTWTRLLEGVPESRLRLVALGGDDPSIVQSIVSRFRRVARSASIEARIQVQGRRTLPDFLRIFHDVDIALDPFPYSGGTTSLHTLWMGVPIVTLEGNSELSRSTSGMIRACGMPDLISQTTDEYLEIARRLAGDTNYLARIRNELRDRLSASTINNASVVTKSLEAAYRTMWSDFSALAQPTARDPKIP